MIDFFFEFLLGAHLLPLMDPSKKSIQEQNGLAKKSDHTPTERIECHRSGDMRAYRSMWGRDEIYDVIALTGNRGVFFPLVLRDSGTVWKQSQLDDRRRTDPFW